jgi:4-hydroxyphenylpyruvate dioxygenase
VRRSIATVSLSGTLAEKLEAASAARFDGVEIFENDLLYFGGSPRDVRQKAGDLGLEIMLYQPFRDFDTQGDELFRRNLARAKRKFDVMDQLGARLMLVCSNVSAHAAEPDRAADQLNQLAGEAARRGIRLGYEALAWGRKVNTYGQAWEIVRKADHPHLGLVLDSFHTLAIEDDVSGIAKIPGDRIFFVQVADAPLMKMDVLSWSRHYRCFPGQGALPVGRFMSEIVRAGYTGPLSLEIFNDEFRASPTRLTAIDGLRSLLFLEEEVRRELLHRREGASLSPPARLRIELFDPPPVPQLDRVAFIEFAVDAASAPKLSAWLERLGFQQAGRHRSKSVSLLRQGDVNLVLNSEKQGFAHSYFLLHGPSVCAIGLAVDDPQSAAARAEAFKATRATAMVQSSESVVPGIRALEGGLVYFVEAGPELAAAFRTDFVLEVEAKPVGAGLGVVDHIAHALPEGQLDSWVLFLKSTLGMMPGDQVVLPDPYGLVRSRAVASPNRAVRFPLNISEDRNTSTARLVSAFSGVGVHHVALSTEDIFATMATLTANAVELLPIPPNYYDDLPAKFDLDPEFVDRLQAHNILYDEDATGSFLQVYTVPFEDRFYFEIVQRTGRYDGYGAANAPVRMAALAQWHAKRHPRGMPSSTAAAT